MKRMIFAVVCAAGTAMLAAGEFKAGFARGYFPFSDAYEGGGYESATSPFGPTVADDLIAGQGRLLERLYR